MLKLGVEGAAYGRLRFATESLRAIPIQGCDHPRRSAYPGKGWRYATVRYSPAHPLNH